MRNVLWDILAKVVSRPRVTNWLIRRAMKTPYTPIINDDLLYMERFWLFNPYPANSSSAKNWFPISIRIHRIALPDQDRHKHDHPWNARTFILRDWYDEVREDGIVYRRRAGDNAALKFGEYHRITEVSPGGVWTLFVTGKYRGTWGFSVEGVKIPWRKYLGLE